MKDSGNGQYNKSRSDRLDEQISSFEEELARKTEERERERAEYYKTHKPREKLVREEEHLAIYKAKAALKNAETRKLRSEGAIHRTWRLFKEMRALRKSMKGRAWNTADAQRSAYAEIFRDCYAPLCEAWEKAVDTAWNFITRLGHDFIESLLFVGDLFIKAIYYVRSALLYAWDLLWDIRLWLDRHKRKIFGIFVIAVATLSVTVVFISTLVAYEYSYYGETLGIAKSKEDVYATIDALGDKLAEASGANISLDVERDIEFKKIYGFNLDVDSTEDILTTLTYMKDLQVRAYAICVDGTQTVILENEATARRVLEGIKSDFSSYKDGTEYTSVEFAENVRIEEVGVLLGDIWNASEAKRYLEEGSLSKVPGMTYEPFINVYTTATETYNENIDYGTKFISNSNLYSDEIELLSAGIYGKNEIVAEVRSINGVEQERQIISTTKLSDPVDEVKYQGTKPIPARTGTGTFIYPVTKYTISSRFGMRWGRMHTGVDFAASTGTKIHAADGGVVEFAGWKGSYGYLIIIDHGGLYETYYAHCSKVNVSAGDKVYQDQTIGAVGSTGNSTGPHLHFEVRYKGEPYNPLDYL